MTPTPASKAAQRTHARAARRLQRAAGRLATTALERMEASLPWFAALPADQRSWVGLVVQSGLAGFAQWLREPESSERVTLDVFATAPREMARLITLQQTVELVRIVVDIAEEAAADLADPGEEAWLRESTLRFSREIAFAAATVYARAAEQRGAWDARLEALVVDAILRGEPDDTLLSRASALGWADPPAVTVVAGRSPHDDPEAVVEAVHRRAAAERLQVLAGVQGTRLVVVLGGNGTLDRGVRILADAFGAGPVVVGPTVGSLSGAWSSALEALAALRAAPAWPAVPRPVTATALLPERALNGEPAALQALVDTVFAPLRDAGGSLLETVEAYLDCGGSVEATARALYVHANTVRYRLGRVADLCGLSPNDPRDGYVLRTAITAGRLRPVEGAL